MKNVIMKDNTKSGLLKSIKLLHELLDEQRVVLLYLKFDVEATRRERDYYKEKAEDK